MALVRGQVVRSRAGRDKDTFLVVLACTGTQVLVCDGKQRPLERPKSKNLRHITMTSHTLCEEEMATNRAIRRALREKNLLAAGGN